MQTATNKRNTKAKLSLYLTPWNPVVTICTASLTFSNSRFCPHSVFVCFVWIWEQTAIISLYSINWLVFTRVRKISKSDYQRRHVCPSVCMEQLGLHWMDFHEIRYMSIFRKSVEKIQVSLQCHKTARYCTWSPIYIYDHLSQFFLQLDMFHTNAVDKINTHFTFNNFFFPKIVPFMG